MTWRLQASAEFKADFRRHCKKNRAFRTAVEQKVQQIRMDPLRFKPLRKPLQGLRRMHVMGCFVLVIEPVASDRVVRLLRLAHHDEAYGY